MKIYNWKNFASGLFTLFLGVVLLAMGFKTGINWGDVVLSVMCFFLGGGTFIRSLSKKMSMEDKLDELDERDNLVQLKNQSLAFKIVEFGCLILEVILFAIGKVANDKMFVYIGVGLAFAFALCLFSDLMTFIHYERKI